MTKKPSLDNITYVRLQCEKVTVGLLQLFNRKGRHPNKKDIEKAETVAPILTSFISLTMQLNDSQNYLANIQRSYKAWQSEEGDNAERLLAAID